MMKVVSWLLKEMTTTTNDLWEGVIRRSQVFSDQFAHAICGSYREDSEGFGLKVTCNFCVRKKWINIEREGAKSGQEQAQKMVSLSNSRLTAVDIGTNVVVRVLDFDRGCLAPRNVLAVVVDVSSSGLYLLRTKKAYLSGCMLAKNSQLLTITSSRHMMCPQVHYLFGQPQW